MYLTWLSYKQKNGNSPWEDRISKYDVFITQCTYVLLPIRLYVFKIYKSAKG